MISPSQKLARRNYACSETLRKVDLNNPAPGVYPSLPFSDYVRIRALNWHTLLPHRISAKQARHDMLMPPDATEDQIIGEAFHACVLEPDRFRKEYAAMPRFAGHPNSNAHKAEKSKWVEAHEQKVLLTTADFNAISSMADALRDHPLAGPMLSGRGRNEITIIWRDEKTGLLCKSRIDRLCYVPALLLYPTSTTFKDGDQILVQADFKSTRAKAWWEFESDISSYCYHGQQSMYADAVKHYERISPLPILVGVQKFPPYDIFPFRMDEDVVDDGRKLYRRLMREHVQCLSSKAWPGAGNSILPVRLKSFVKEPSIESE